MIFITSKERREKRYYRRKMKRLEKKKIKMKLEELFSYDNLYHSGLNCFKNVGWKQSIQVYRYQLVSRTAKTRQDIINGVWKSKGFHKFTISERGKRRNISSVDIEERIVQKCICDNALVESFSSSFIYDNGASLKGKGSDFTMDRLNCHLQRYYRKYGVEGYVLLFDLTDFFNSAPHKDVAKEILIRFEDARIANFIIQLMKNYGDVGFGLGSQTSQIECLMVLNGLDHMIKEKLRIKGYGRYNDDAYLIHNDKEYLEYCLE